MRKVLLVIISTLLVTKLAAQDDYEYKMEIGAGVGMVSYEGDFNGNITKNMQPAATLLFRRVLNPYMALRLAGTFGKLKGSSADVKTYYPDYQSADYSFNHTLVDVSATYEYNFWPYGTGRDYRGAKRVTPYIYIGLGATSVSGGEKNVFTANVPLGLGIKYKLGDRTNLALAWGVHFTFSDELDGVKDPYGVKSSGAFKNTDCYSALQVTISYSFSAKCKTCNKDY